MSNRPGPLGQAIARELRVELARQDKTRRWLADQLGQSHVNVARWVKGDGPISLDNLDEMCRALRLSVVDLLMRAESLPHPEARVQDGGRASSDYGSEGWGFEYLRVHHGRRRSDRHLHVVPLVISADAA